MQMSRLLATTNVSLTTSAAAVTAPTTLGAKTVAVVAGARSSGAWVEWVRQAASDSTYSATCPDFKEALDISVNPGQTPFYAKVASGTATLEVEWWG